MKLSLFIYVSSCSVNVGNNMEKISRFLVSKFGELCDELVVNMSGLATDYYFFFIRNNYT